MRQRSDNFELILLGFTIALVFAFKSIFDNLFYSWTMRKLELHFGIMEAEVIAAFSSIAVPTLCGIALVWGLYRYLNRELRREIEAGHTVTAEHSSALSESLRSAVQKLLRYPDAVEDTVAPPTMIERFAADQQPRRLFELLVHYEEKDIGAVPRIGEKLCEHFALYYEFRQSAIQFDDELLTKIINGKDWFLSAWQIHQRYVTLRLLGPLSNEQIIAGGNFLNYGITWDAAEKVFERVSGDGAITSAASQLGALHERLSAMVIALKAST